MCNRLTIRPESDFNAIVTAEYVVISSTIGSIEVCLLTNRIAGWLDDWTNDRKLAVFKAYLADRPIAILYPLLTPV